MLSEFLQGRWVMCLVEKDPRWSTSLLYMSMSMLKLKLKCLYVDAASKLTGQSMDNLLC